MAASASMKPGRPSSSGEDSAICITTSGKMAATANQFCALSENVSERHVDDVTSFESEVNEAVKVALNSLVADTQTKPTKRNPKGKATTHEGAITGEVITLVIAALQPVLVRVSYGSCDNRSSHCLEADHAWPATGPRSSTWHGRRHESSTSTGCSRRSLILIGCRSTAAGKIFESSASQRPPTRKRTTSSWKWLAIWKSISPNVLSAWAIA